MALDIEVIEPTDLENMIDARLHAVEAASEEAFAHLSPEDRETAGSLSLVLLLFADGEVQPAAICRFAAAAVEMVPHPDAEWNVRRLVMYGFQGQSAEEVDQERAEELAGMKGALAKLSATGDPTATTLDLMPGGRYGPPVN
jgi:hypothetical protein